MTKGEIAIFTKVAGPFVGLLLVIYGTLSLWLNSTRVSPAKRAQFCELLLCQPASADSPISIEPPANKTLAQARAALLMEPASAYRWADLADSEIDAHNIEGGKFSIRQALAAAPGNPSILFHTANFYLRLQDYPDTLSNLLSVLRNPDLSPFYNRVFQMYSQMDMPLEDLLSQGLPHTAQAASGFLHFWIDQNKLEEAQETWNWINKNNLTSLQSAGSYITLLSKDGKWDEALQSWSQFSSQIDPAYTKTNWIYNGSFEAAPVDCPFDWHLTSAGPIQVDRDTESMYKGAASLRIRFLGAPTGTEPQAYQTVILKPGTWQIKAAIKALGDQSVVIRVVDAEDPARLDAATEILPETSQWATVNKTFQVGPNTRLARVEILRPPGRESTARVTATIWVDAITLTPTT